VLATSDLRDVQPLEEMVLEGHRREAEVPLRRHDGKHRGRAHRQAKADAAWFANAKYLLSSPRASRA
jgi:Ca-activated chloride channel family protein